jgi:hypothetical protein
MVIAEESAKKTQVFFDQNIIDILGKDVSAQGFGDGYLISPSMPRFACHKVAV